MWNNWRILLKRAMWYTYGIVKYMYTKKVLACGKRIIQIVAVAAAVSEDDAKEQRLLLKKLCFFITKKYIYNNRYDYLSAFERFSGGFFITEWNDRTHARALGRLAQRRVGKRIIRAMSNVCKYQQRYLVPNVW